MMNFKRNALAGAIAGIAATGFSPVAASADPVEWLDTGHYYETHVADGINWPAASTAAEQVVEQGDLGLRCYLATITSSAEDQHVHSLRSSTPGINTTGEFENAELWVGGHQSLPAGPADLSWTWVNNEDLFNYTNWLPNEPNDAGGDERYLAIGWQNNFGWNDEAHLDGIHGYVQECQADVVANADAVEATSGVPKDIDVLANDDLGAVDIDDISVTIPPDQDTLGAVTVGSGPDFLITYQSPTDFPTATDDTDTFVYKVTHTDGAYAFATVTVTVVADISVVEPGVNQLIFNQAQDPSPDSNNPMTAAYQQVLVGGEVKISCCKVLDTREGAGRHGSYKASTFDLGRAIADTETNPSCVDMPPVPNGKAVLRPWHRGVPLSEGLIDVQKPPPADARENDLGVCFIEANVASRGVVFSAEEASNVLGYSLNGAVETLRYRPFTGGVSLDPVEVDKPYVTPWTAEWDESRSGKRFSDNLMVVNLWHEWSLMPSVPYLLDLASSLDKSIDQVKAQGCVENNDGYLNKLKLRVTKARANILLAAIPWLRTAAGQAAVDELNDATRQALLIGAPDGYDPYGSCPGNPQGLFAGRMMSLKFAACSELTRPFDSASSLDGACMIAEDILCALPELPGFPHPASCAAPQD